MRREEDGLAFDDMLCRSVGCDWMLDEGDAECAKGSRAMKNSINSLFESVIPTMQSMYK